MDEYKWGLCSLGPQAGPMRYLYCSDVVQIDSHIDIKATCHIGIIIRMLCRPG